MRRLLLTCSALLALLVPARAQADAGVELDLETGVAVAGGNDVAIPGDSGTRLSLTEDLDGATPQVLSLTEVPEEEWIKDCYTSNSHSVSEVFTVSPDPVVIGALSIPSPGLTTKCGGRVLLGSVVDGNVVDPTLGFTE